MRDAARFAFKLPQILATIACLWAASGCGIITNNQETPKNACINNLRLMDGAKEQWGLENHKGPGDVPTWTDLQPYLGSPGAPLPKCPEGGIYTLGALSNKPTCSIPGHALP